MTAAPRQSETAGPPARPGAADDPIPDIADDLADMLRRGRMAGPDGVARVVYTTVTGRVISVDLPPPVDRGASPPMAPKARPRLTPLAEDILDVLTSAGEPMFGADIAFRINPDQSHTDGAFRDAIRALRAAELIESGNAYGYRLAQRQ